jgi:hypothetical protein
MVNGVVGIGIDRIKGRSEGMVSFGLVQPSPVKVIAEAKDAVNAVNAVSETGNAICELRLAHGTRYDATAAV